jgi:branched-chain amino acid transport system substrate-binding protein
VIQRSNRYLAAGAAVACALFALHASAAEPITIGFGMALTGGLAGAGKPALLAMQIWQDDINAKGGLLGRPVKLVYYDDQTSPPAVPGIYTKLLDVDKVDLIVSGYGTNMIAPAMPVAMSHDRLFLGLFGLAVNSEFHYPKYFSMLPNGPDPAHAFAEPFFKVALQGNPKPKTVAIVGADAEYPKKATEGARDIAKEGGLKIVYDRSYPPSTADFSPIVHAIQATDPEIVFVASYPPDSAGMLRAATEIGLKTRYFGGGMVGLQYTSVKQQFGPKLNGVIDYDFWIPAPTMQFPGILDFLKKYQAKAPAEGVDPLGWYLPPFA